MTRTPPLPSTHPGDVKIAGVIDLLASGDPRFDAVVFTLERTGECVVRAGGIDLADPDFTRYRSSIPIGPGQRLFLEGGGVTQFGTRADATDRWSVERVTSMRLVRGVRGIS